MEILYVLGDRNLLGIPMFQFDGTPVDPADLEIRMLVGLPDGAPDLVIPGSWRTGNVQLPGDLGPSLHPAIASFSFSPEEVPLEPMRYRARLQIDDGTGWWTVPGEEITVEVEQP